MDSVHRYAAIPVLLLPLAAFQAHAQDPPGVRGASTMEACDAASSEAAGIALRWEQVRSSLGRTTARDAADRVTGVYYSRELAQDGAQLGVAETEEFDGVAIPFPAPPLEMRERAVFGVATDGGVAYVAPTAEALLSDAFGRRHCVTRVVRDSETPRVGLAFEPLPNGAEVDLAGTIWIDSVTTTMHSVEFDYRAPAGAGPAGAGGLVEYRTGRAGIPQIVRWRLRVPQVRRYTDAGGPQELRTIREEGALVFGGGRMPISDPDHVAASLSGAFRLDALVAEGTAQSTRPRDATPGSRPSNTLSADEIRFGAQTSALDLIQLTRPHWLRLRGGARLTGAPTGVVVYLDGMRMSGGQEASISTASALRGIPAAWIGTVQYLDPIEAPMFFGIGHDNGAIVITSRRR
ncbi:MAG: hypothetical protein WEF86_04305 [Gemmatimonadota bacterium]